MELLFFITIFFAAIMGAYACYKSRNLLNPIGLILIFFLFPLAINQLKLSSLQPDSWNDSTYYLISIFLLSFVMVPSFIIIFFNDKFKINHILKNARVVDKKEKAIISTLIAILSQLTLNYLSSGFFIPLFHMSELDGSYHVVDIPFWGILFTGFWYVSCFHLFNYYYFNGGRIFLLLLAVITFFPLSRLARFDIFNLCLSYLIFIYMLSPDRTRLILKSLFLGGLLAILGSYVALYRWSVGGAFDVSFSDEIGFKIWSGPFEVFAFLYSYFPLSIENIDRFTSTNNDIDIVYGAFMLRPILVGLFKMHRMDGFPYTHHFEVMRDRLTGVATVPTALPEFAIDFGILLSFIPMLLYSLLGVYFYKKACKSLFGIMIFSFYSMSYFVVSFQNTFIQPNFIYFFVVAYLMRFFGFFRVN